MTMDVIAASKRLTRKFFHRPKYSRRQFGAIGPHCRIGDECALVPENMYLDDYVVIQNRVNFISSEGRLVVKRHSVISSQCIIIPGTHTPVAGMPFYFQTMEHIGDDHATITIEEDCWIGAGSILLMKSRIGRGAVVAAGSVVTKAVPPYAVVAGNPARIIGVKFSKEDVLRHEKALYPESERLSIAEIEKLYEDYYVAVSPMAGKAPESVGVRYDCATGKLTGL